MALGIHQFNAVITTDTDTTLFAAPGNRERINIRWITVDVQVGGTATALARIEDAAGGNIVATLDTSDDNNRLERVYHVKAPSKGYQLSVNTALNAESTSNSSAATLVINGEVEVTGG